MYELPPGRTLRARRRRTWRFLVAVALSAGLMAAVVAWGLPW